VTIITSLVLKNKGSPVHIHKQIPLNRRLIQRKQHHNWEREHSTDRKGLYTQALLLHFYKGKCATQDRHFKNQNTKKHWV